VATLAEELLLLALDPRVGRPRTPAGGGWAVLAALGRGSGPGTSAGIWPWLGQGLAGALLAELALAGRVDLSGGHVAVRGRAAVGQPALDWALARLAHAPRPPRTGAWLAGEGRGRRLVERVAAGLVAAGTLRRERRRLLLLGVTRYPTVDPAPRRAALGRLRGVVAGAAEADARTALLLGLLVACDGFFLLDPPGGGADGGARARAWRRARALLEPARLAHQPAAAAAAPILAALTAALDDAREPMP
jgi:Golgi phosphoprotein 3 (GPP34)